MVDFKLATYDDEMGDLFWHLSGSLTVMKFMNNFALSFHFNQ